jgi:flagellar biosynthesis/type III secretory pathway chaperone
MNMNSSLSTVSFEQVTEMQICLESEIKYLTELSDILSQERVAIEENQADQLDSVRHTKELQLQQLADAAEKQSQLLQQAQCLENAAGLDQFIEKSPALYQSLLRDLRTDFKKQLQNCQDYNLSNGMILNLRLRNTQTLLQVLRGNTAGEGELYGKDGRL